MASGVHVGGEPHVDADWDRLAQLGVRTIVGVDALAPDADAARRRGLRVVHVPLGYGGITPAEAGVLARVARECERPLYVYCHHGRHRGPAAAAVLCRAAGLLDERGAIDLLREAGTSPDYVGLWRSVAEFDPATPPSDRQLVARAAASPLAIEMSRLDRAWDDFAADRAAAKLVVVREALRESRRHAWASLPAAATEGLEASFDAADRAFQALARDPESAAAGRAFEAACTACHARHRN